MGIGRRMRRELLASSIIATVSCIALAAPADAASLEPRIYGGTQVHGNPTAVRIAQFDGTEWPTSCTGIMLRPRLIMTSAHCMTIEGSGAGVAGFAVFAPGATAVSYRDLGPQGASDAHVINVWKPSGYANLGGLVQPNDIAILQLDRDLGPAAFTRIASRFDVARALATGAGVEHTGYGNIALHQDVGEPFDVTLPLVYAAPVPTRGDVFGTAQSAASGICSGDSGSPAYLNTADGRVLLGPMAGGNSPCSGNLLYGNVGYLAMGYLDIVNAALASAGHPTIPSAPRNLSLTVRNRDVVASWDPPTTSPQTVVGYDVIDAAGTVRCQTTSTSCTITGLPDGAYGFTVRSRNAESEGDALPIGPQRAVVATPTTPNAPSVRQLGPRKVRITVTAPASTASVSRFVVRDARGSVVCRMAPSAVPSRPAGCTVTLTPGRHRFTAQADTTAGLGAPSPASRTIRIR